MEERQRKSLTQSESIVYIITMTIEAINTTALEELRKTCLLQHAKITKLEQELSYFKKQLFGSKSERFVPVAPEQCALALSFGDSATEGSAVLEEAVSYTRMRQQQVENKPGHSRQSMPTHLPIKDIRIEPDEDISHCKYIGDDVSWEYDYQCGHLSINRTIRPKYARPDGEGIVTGKLPARPVEKGNFSAGFIANVINEKFNYHIPLDRQRKRFLSESDVSLAESTLCDVVSQGCFWLESVYQEQAKLLRQTSYIQADETPMPVIVRDGRGKTHKGYFWVYYDPLSHVVVFDYQTGRGREGPNKFLSKFSGTVQVDGYTGYNELLKRPDIHWAACMAHVRRKFMDAIEYDRAKSEFALNIINGWFERERQYKEEALLPASRLEQRQIKIVSEMEAFGKWLEEQAYKVLPKSPLGKAISYAHKQWKGFKPYQTDGSVELSNNLVENAIRPVAIGRKNYLFKGSHDAAKRAAVIYSLSETAKRHGLDPYRYFKMILSKLPAEKHKNLANYLPNAF